MPNRNSSAGTKVDSSTHPKLQRPAKLLPNPMLAAQPVWLDVAENDNNGKRSGKITAISLFGCEIEIEANNFEGVSFIAIAQETITCRLINNEFKFPYIDKNYWIGNIIWNTYLIRFDVFIDFINWCAKSKLFSCTSAPTEFYEAFNNGKTITAECVEACR